MPQHDCLGRVCSLCKEYKIWEEFYNAKNGFQGKHSRCKGCMNKERTVAYKGKYREQGKFNRLKLKYGLSREDFESMYSEQNGRCKICDTNIKKHSEQQSKVAAVDHCHTTGVVRGLLCSRCNRALGLFEDDPNLLSKAADYLAAFQ